jgi:hypothetical protein
MRQMNANTSRIVLGRHLLGAVAAGFLAVGSAVAEPAAAPAAAPQETKKVVQRSPGEVATQVCALLANRRTPWQIYGSYIGIFQDFAQRQARVPAATPEAQMQRQRLVAHYQGMASLLQQMQECAKIRDGIKQNQTDLPAEQRRDAFREASTQLDEHFVKFVAMSRQLPGFRIDERLVKRPPAVPAAVPVAEGELFR